MPFPLSIPTDAEMRSRRDSFPPTQVRVEVPKPGKTRRQQEDRPLLDDIDDDPLTYFLTPTPGFEDDEQDMELDGLTFDAGIEDPSQPREIVRSVSPSSLDGGFRSPGSNRSSSPCFDSDATSGDEDEDEEYIHFSPSSPRLTPLRDLFVDGLGQRPQSPLFNRSANGLLSPASFPAIRGRSHNRPVRSRSLSAARSRNARVWREPSPDVWSIEEETEEELQNENSIHIGDGLDTQAAKPKKRVRFLLPNTN
ncbi:unnamed protein product [Clonostachys rosea f. rosea IK726]|jgi:hypothetical protein|uniref:Uncharacterized protein n=2 Tax=Bionectria ochroleuca TaxID=29856 RepID=A0A0B7JR47_BIOOC|nr:unnamed protein product [Clonostachys rosea f. rosea IK726]